MLLYYQKLNTGELPDNILVAKYPNIKIAENYPVYNDLGEIEPMNINGIGVALEFYLGKNNLKIDDDFFPITITKDGHGKFKNKVKTKIQTDFELNLEFLSTKSPAYIREQLPEMNKIFELIFELSKLSNNTPQQRTVLKNN